MSEEGNMVLKQTPLTNEELESIRWRVWEPLRRNQDYINDCRALVLEDYYNDTDSFKTFGKKWKLTYPIDPEIEFVDLKDKAQRPWFANLFREHYKPIFDHVAVVPFDEFIVDGKYLVLLISRTASKNQIEAAVKKILDEWWSDKWVNFYTGHRRTSSEPVKVQDVFDDDIKILIDLRARRTTDIEPKLKKN